MDFKKAFDTVDHQVLRYKLQAVGITGDLHEWIIDYLSDRKQYVEINGVRSSIRIVEISVPQGSLLGPRLYAVYANDLPGATVLGYIHMFADDTTIYYIGKEIEEIVDILNLMLKDFEVWCSKNRLTVHTGKTEAMIISARPFTGPMRPIILGKSYIQFTTKTTCLGVVIDNKLSWRPHIDSLHKKYGGKLKFLKRMKGLPTSVLEEVYYKGIVPSVTYGIAVWGTCSISIFNDREQLHIKAAKLIYKIPSETPDLDVLRIANWKPLNYIYKRRLATLMYQVKAKTLHEPLTDLFELNKNDDRYSLRNKNDYSRIRYNNEYGRNSVRYRGPIVWNNIPQNIKDAETQQSFKAKLKQAGKKLEQIQFEKEACTIQLRKDDFLYF